MISRPLLILLCGSTLAGPVVAGSLDAPAAPDNAASAMYTLGDLYKRINTGAAATAPAGGFTEPAIGPAPTGYTLTELYNLASQRARPAKTGQTPTVPLNPAPAGSDGALQKGVTLPSPRFTDNSNGTVTDNLTGLIWLKNAGCLVGGNWAGSLTAANTLNTGECGLTDGSAQGDWRLPNVRELFSLIDFGRFQPALPSGHPFLSVSWTNYWSSTSAPPTAGFAWYVSLSDGTVYAAGTSVDYPVWSVRGGQ